MLTSSEEQALASKLREYESKTSAQILIATRQNLGGEEIATYATELGHSLGVGQGDEDNGIVILVAREERQVFIAVGYGMEAVVPDAAASRIVRSTITPMFKQGRFFMGLSLAVDELIMLAAGEFPPEIRATRSRASDEDLGGTFCSVLFFVLMVVLLVAKFRNRGGGGGGGPRGRNNAILPLMLLIGSTAGRGLLDGLAAGGRGASGGGGFGVGGFGGGGGAGGGW